MILYDLINHCDVKYCTAEPTLEISGVCTDSRLLKQGDAFIAIRGTKQDGHDFIPSAISSGASLIVAEDGFEKGGIIGLCSSSAIPLVIVSNTRRASAFMYSNFNDSPASKLRLIAVTGTNGKTTTTYMLRAIFAAASINTAIIGTTTSALTTPDPEQLYPRLRELHASGVQYVMMEASSHALALDKLAPIIFEAGIFTNLTPEHLDFHVTMENYYQSKAKLFERCRLGLFNHDDEYGVRMYQSALCDKMYFGRRDDGEYLDFTTVNAINRGVNGIEYSLLSRDLLFRVSSPMTGDFNISNSLGAACCAIALGIPPKAVRDGLRTMRGVPGRMERVYSRRDDIAVFIDFAHTPDALENLLRSVRKIMNPNQRLTVLFGCGGDRDRTKRSVMGSIASRLADFVIITSDNSRSEKPGDIISQILRGIDRERPHKVIENRRDAIEWAVRTAQSGDVIILAGKGHEKYEITADGIHPFNEAEIVAKA